VEEEAEPDPKLAVGIVPVIFDVTSMEPANWALVVVVEVMLQVELEQPIKDMLVVIRLLHQLLPMSILAVAAEVLVQLVLLVQIMDQEAMVVLDIQKAHLLFMTGLRLMVQQKLSI